jgi:hypothetical protein
MKIVKKYKIGIHDSYKREREKEKKILICETSKLEEILNVADRNLSR